MSKLSQLHEEFFSLIINLLNSDLNQFKDLDWALIAYWRYLLKIRAKLVGTWYWDKIELLSPKEAFKRLTIDSNNC